MAKKHLVITTTSDSSTELFSTYADIILIDREPAESIKSRYDTVYIRSQFSKPATLPQNFRAEVKMLVQSAKIANPEVSFVDDMDDVNKILALEDKWLQYGLFKEFMPVTKPLESPGKYDFIRPVFKKRLSSRGTGVTWDIAEVGDSMEQWIVQESIAIEEKLRVYVICGAVHPVGVVRRSKTAQQKVKAVNIRSLSHEEIDFASHIDKTFAGLDFTGIDLARTKNGTYSLIEVNRSPDFLRFTELTGINLASILYSGSRKEAE